jgi:hypothetical protein
MWVFVWEDVLPIKPALASSQSNKRRRVDVQTKTMRMEKANQSPPMTLSR